MRSSLSEPSSRRSSGSHREELRRLEAVEEQIDAIKEALQSDRVLVLVDDESLQLSIEPYEEERQTWLAMWKAAAEEATEDRKQLSEELSRLLGMRVRVPGPGEQRLAQKLPILAELADEVIWDTLDDHEYVRWIFRGAGLARLLQMLGVHLRIHPDRVQTEGVLPMSDIEVGDGCAPTQQLRGSCTGGRRITVMELPFLLEFPIGKGIRRAIGSEAA